MLTPRSSIGLLLLAFFVVSAPLVIGNLRALVQVDRLATQSDELVVNSINVVKESAAVEDALTEMERYARQFKILEDDALLDRYHDRRKSLEAMLFRIGSLISDARISADLDTIESSVKASGELMGQSKSGSQDIVLAIDNLASLDSAVDRISIAANETVQSELRRIDQATENARRSLAWQSWMLAPATVALALLFTYLVQRPLRQTGIAIRQLGEGRLEQPIVVNGPEDMRVLGHELDWLRTRLLQSEQENDQFLRRVSHELKTPLASVREGIELLVDGTVGSREAEGREVMELVRDNSLELQRQIENLLAYNMRNIQEHTVRFTRLKLNEIIDGLRERHRLTLTSRNIELRLLDTTTSLFADREKMRVVLENLISNAIRYSPDGGTVTVAAIDMDDGSSIVEVMDLGPGIPNEERRFIFRPFYQGKPSSQAHALRGTGLGLSVAVDNVRAQGGTLTLVNSSHGARFRITLPERTEENAACEPTFVSSSAPA